jgi:hypothetical protein
MFLKRAGWVCFREIVGRVGSLGRARALLYRSLHHNGKLEGSLALLVRFILVWFGCWPI